MKGIKPSALDSITVDAFKGSLGITELEEHVDSSLNDLYSRPSGGGDSSAGYFETTYEGLVNLIKDSSLIPGSHYAITDFATAYYQTTIRDVSGAQTVFPCNKAIDLSCLGNPQISVDQVGDNPVTKYARALYLSNFELDMEDLTLIKRSLLSDEFTFIEGDSSTTTMWFLTGSENEGFVNKYYDTGAIVILKGPSTGYYNEAGFAPFSYFPEQPYVFMSESWVPSGESIDLDMMLNLVMTVKALDPSELEIQIGETEPLITFALSNSVIDKAVYSPNYPKDIIHYDWDPSNWVNCPNFYYDASLVPGWKGVITKRHDTVLNNHSNNDFRNVKYRVWYVDASVYDPSISYSQYDVFIVGEGVLAYAITDIEVEDTSMGEKVRPLFFRGNYSFSDEACIITDYTPEQQYSIKVPIRDNIYFKDFYWINDPLRSTLYTIDASVSTGNYIPVGVDSSLGVLFPFIILGENSKNNIFGNNCRYNIINKNSFDNTFGNSCYFNLMPGGLAQYGMDQYGYSNNTMGNGFTHNLFMLGGVTYNRFEDGICNINFGYSLAEGISLGNQSVIHYKGPGDGQPYIYQSYIFNGDLSVGSLTIGSLGV